MSPAMTMSVNTRSGRNAASCARRRAEPVATSPPGLTVQLDVKAHADEILARRTVDVLARVLARRADADRELHGRELVAPDRR